MTRPTAKKAAASATAALVLTMIPHAAGAATPGGTPAAGTPGAAASGMVAPQVHSGPVRYTERPLGFDASIHDLNDLGVVVGESAGHAFSWSARTGQKTDLGTLGGPSSVAYGVNDWGHVVGASDVGGARHAVVWTGRGHEPLDLGTLGGPNSTALAINNFGVVVGESDTTAGVSHAFRWDPRTRRMSDLGTLGGDSSAATAINDRGQIAGWARTSAFLAHAFRWDPRSGHLQDLGVAPDGVVSFATGINNRGEVVGYTNNVGDFTDRAFRWDPRTASMSRLPGLPDAYSHATGINDLGQVAGFWDDQSGSATPFVWSPRLGAPITLPTMDAPPFSVFVATSAINNRSWVAGSDGAAVLWMPTHGH